MERKERLDTLGIVLMLIFASVFAYNQVAIKVTNDGLQPVFAAGMRSLVGLLVLLIWVKWSGAKLGMTRAQWRGAALVGALFTFEFLCLFLALDMTSVSRGSVIFYTMPFWLGLAAHFLLPGERLSGLRLAGFALALGGVALAFSDRGSGEGSLAGDLLALGAALGWAGIALTVRLSKVSEASAEAQLFAQLVISAAVFLGISPFFGPLVRDFQTIHVWTFGYQAIITVMVGFLLWFRIMKIYPASDVASFSFLTPVMAVIMGWALLGDEVGYTIIGSLCMVCLGLVLISRRKRPASSEVTRPAS